MQHTIAAVFDNRDSAQQALEQLANAGYARADMRLNQSDASGNTDPFASDASGASATEATSAGPTTAGTGSGIKHFFSNLFGSDDGDTQAYTAAVERGHYVLTLDAPDESAVERAADIIEGYGPIDIDEYATGAGVGSASIGGSDVGGAALHGGGGAYQQASYSGQQSAMGDMSQSAQGELSQSATAARQGTLTQGSMQRAETASADTQSIPVMQEALKVGKRAVRRGGVRIYQRMVETPVQESVNLQEEHVRVERRPMNLPIDPADISAFQETTFEVRESAEEAVVEKSARIVEEVVVGKDVSERQEHISDTLRSTEVEVEQIDAGGSPAGNMDDSAFRTHWSSNFADGGETYDDYAPAYRYGSSMAGSALYQGRPWDDVEPDLRRNWESSNPTSAWDKFKSAVREGWERMTA